MKYRELIIYDNKLKLSEMIVQAANHNEKIGVVFIDLDRGLKPFNDNMGHWFGDKLLMAVPIV